MPPAAERMHRTSWGRWDLHFPLSTTLVGRGGGERGVREERQILRGVSEEQSNVQHLRGWGKREVNIRTIQLGAYYEPPGTSALQRAVMVIFPICFLIYCTKSRKAMPKV